jgi:hypothetical protein
MCNLTTGQGAAKLGDKSGDLYLVFINGRGMKPSARSFASFFKEVSKNVADAFHAR